MQIREATDLDIPEILGVLKASLGETSSRKTESVWRYKHVDNPFGKSLVLLAIENEQIIGVRALMRWEWQLGKQKFSSLRAVDTATLPEHQGKGVFKKLTLNAIEIAKEKGDNFIFNTPNTQSLPGYLKMAWQKVDKIKIRLSLNNPFNWPSGDKKRSYHQSNSSSFDSKNKLILKYNIHKAEKNKLFTPKSSKYLSWRYENNPLQKYEIRADDDFYLAGYIKERKFFNELRITEHIYNNEKGLVKIKECLNEFSKKFNALIISTTEELNYGVGISGNYGPVFTLRNLNLNTNLNQELLNLDCWSYSIGDLELF